MEANIYQLIAASVGSAALCLLAAFGLWRDGISRVLESAFDALELKLAVGASRRRHRDDMAEGRAARPSSFVYNR
ncbi:MAG: hypothetical protein ACRD9R_09775 [Pyrinomonadaceae bacterium]